MATKVPSGTRPSTAELAAEMLTLMRAKGLVVQQHQSQVTPADAIVSGIPPTQPALTNVISLMTGEQESPPFPILSVPVDLHIDSKTKAKIHANNFVDFVALLNDSSSQVDQYQLEVTGNRVALVPTSKVTQINNMERWMEAFNVFVSIYSEAHPLQTPALMKHATIVHGIAKRSEVTAALFYDVNFRKWHQRQSTLQWGVINNELFLQAGSMTGGTVSRFKGPFQSANPSRPGRCWDFMRTGFCARGKQCRFSHRCIGCGGPHHIKNCPAKGQ